MAERAPLPLGARARLGRYPDIVNIVAVSPDGRVFATVHNNEFVSGVERPIHLWDARTNKHLRVVTGASTGVMSAAFSPDGALLVAGTIANKLHVWEVKTGKSIAAIPHTGHVYAVSFSANGEKLLTGSNQIRLFDARTQAEIRSFSAANPNRRHEYFFYAVIFPDGKRAASGSDNTVRMWDADTGMLLHTIKTPVTAHVNRLAFSADGATLLMTAASHPMVRKWDVASGEPIPSPPQNAPLAQKRGVFSRDQRLTAWEARSVADSSDVYALLIRDADGREVCRINSPAAVASYEFSADGKHLLVGARDGSLRVYDSMTAEKSADCLDACSPVLRLRLPAGEGKDLVSLHANNSLHAWDIKTGTERRRAMLKIPDGRFIVASSPDGRQVVAADARGIFTLLDVDTGRALFTSEAPLHLQPPEPIGPFPTPLLPPAKAAPPQGTFALAFSGDGQFVAGLLADRKEIAIWKTADGTRARSIKTSDACSCLALNHDGTTLVIGKKNPLHGPYLADIVVFIDPANGKELLSLAVPPVFRQAPMNPPQIGMVPPPVTAYSAHALRLSPDGKMLALIQATTTQTFPPFGAPAMPTFPSTSYKVRIWDVATKKVIQELATDQVPTFAFSSDSTLLAAGSYSKLWVMDLATRQNFAAKDHAGTINILLFTPDAGTLISGGSNATVVLWDVAKLRK
jgi:WD40 repeat protein